GLHGLRAGEMRLELVALHAERRREAQEELERRPRHLVEAGFAVHERRQRDEEPAPPAARDGGRRALRAEPGELVVLLQPAAPRLALDPAVLERLRQRGLDRLLA